MSTLIENIEKRFYQNKPKYNEYGQYSFGKINPEDPNSILGINQISENISGGWIFADETDSSWNHLYTRIEKWTDHRYEGEWYDGFEYPLEWVDLTGHGWWCIDNVNMYIEEFDHIFSVNRQNCHNYLIGPDPCECWCQEPGGDEWKWRSGTGVNCDTDSDCNTTCTDYCSSFDWTEYIETYDESIERFGLNPRNQMSLEGFPTDWDEETIITNIEKIDNLRPISFVTSKYNTDLQSYYQGEDINSLRLRSLSSAPNLVTFKFDIAENFQNNVPNLVDLTELPFDFFNYHYFVMDWDWSPSDDHWGPAENDPFTNFQYTADFFPKTQQELVNLEYQQLFDLKNINESISHYYITPGIKTIKVMHLTTMQNSATLESGDYIPPGQNITKYKFELMAELYEAAGLANVIPITNPELQGYLIPETYDGAEDSADNKLFATNAGTVWQTFFVYYEFCQPYFADAYLLNDEDALAICTQISYADYPSWNWMSMGHTGCSYTSWEKMLIAAGICLGYETESCYENGQMNPNGECWHPDTGEDLYWNNLGSNINGQWLGVDPLPMDESNSVTIPWGSQTINSWNADAENYIQAVDWKLMTIKIFLDDEGAVSLADYEDIGGDEYVYLPYPDIVNLPIYDEDGNDIHGFSPIGTPYKSSHPIISGLSENSTYIASLRRVVESDKFSFKEENERTLFRRAKDLGPTGNRDEWGQFLGKADIAQIRMFNNPEFDMAKLLGIQTIYDFNNNDIYGEEGEFHPYDDCDYWYQENIKRCDTSNLDGKLFPEESPVGDIFISEYDQFKDYCLFEINCEQLNEKSFDDTTGMGNKGILFGDFSIDKQELDQSANRDSYIKIPKLNNKDGAF